MERERVVITIRSRLWEESLRTLQFSDIGISSTALVHVQTLSHGIRPRSNQYTSKVVCQLDKLLMKKVKLGALFCTD
jgi:hypothetical protein